MTKLRFSERAGHKPVKDQLQTDGIDDDLRNSLWSVFYSYVLKDDLKAAYHHIELSEAPGKSGRVDSHSTLGI